MLHIVKSLEKLKLVSRYLQPTDDLLLVENAVYASSQHSEYYSQIVVTGQIFALQEDLQARGWSENSAQNIQIINRFEFVELTISHSKSISW
ncbi:sulfurtransferase complex subunit TusB [Vibrio ziniensis]|uniref:Sulfurtransferase complex subunit TusB n=1 Tax=Vibrio ziniensis TaxID=2711221 RepID=A0A6G7CL99_9VIBR|nr:sulfurtransferase complex subunit TusB [Vibrio ziniensis]QIH42879.1 sulfurtransferase complex subunit TusB [Vibrio ziniensis]